MKKIVKVGSRESKLAVIQAEMVMRSICKSHPDIETKLVTMSSFGDKNTTQSLDSIGKANLFSDTLEQALYDGEIDIAVHSYKDLPIDLGGDLPIVALGERANPFDALVIRADAPDDAVIGTSCKRRALQIVQLYPDFTAENIRGAVTSRLDQMDSGDYDGLILAVAGLDRLGLGGRIGRIFTPDEIVPSACQGIVAVQGRKNEDYNYLSGFDCDQSHIVSQAEISFVRALNQNGSSYNNGVYAEISGNEIQITGIFITDQNEIIKGKVSGDVSESIELTDKLIKQILDRSL